jgi:hypothetical protein
MESNMSPNMSPKQNGHLVGARKLLILTVGTAGFEPTASCTPKKVRYLFWPFPEFPYLAKFNKYLYLTYLMLSSVAPHGQSNVEQ